MPIKFHLPGLRNNFPLNMLTLKMFEAFPDYFRKDIQIASFFGEFPTCLWNGGRYSGDDQCDSGYVRHVIQAINAAGIAVRYTINSSTCKEIRSVAALNEELEKDYGLVVLDYNLNNCFDELLKITDKSRCEILVNSCCVPNCPRRAEHYRFIGTQEKAALTNRTLPAGKQKPVPTWSCGYGEQNSLSKYKKYKTHVSPDDIWDKYVPMGFENFKLEGRTANLFLLVDTYCYYFATINKKLVQRGAAGDQSAVQPILDCLIYFHPLF